MPRLAASAAAALILLAIGVGTGLRVSRLEEHDSFCTSCHTVPEVTYFERAQAALGGQTPYADLSSAHYGRAPSSGEQMAIRCIDCHRGSGSLPHRAVTLTLGARDALIWVTGQSNPTIEKSELIVPFLLTAACVECHLDVLLVAGFNNHFHNRLPEAFRAWAAGGQLRPPDEQPGLPEADLRIEPVETAVQCVDCHRAHIHIPGAELQAYLDIYGVVYPACIRCHEDAGRGPLELADLDRGGPQGL
ncbi:MAG TPA: hypothetical protein VJJ46_09430 [Anaerolineales bacterium]|nr:hypothetical protein [Anaerolineales bacterium]